MVLILQFQSLLRPLFVKLLELDPVPRLLRLSVLHDRIVQVGEVRVSTNRHVEELLKHDPIDGHRGSTLPVEDLTRLIQGHLLLIVVVGDVGNDQLEVLSVDVERLVFILVRPNVLVVPPRKQVEVPHGLNFFDMFIQAREESKQSIEINLLVVAEHTFWQIFLEVTDKLGGKLVNLGLSLLRVLCRLIEQHR